MSATKSTSVPALPSTMVAWRFSPGVKKPVRETIPIPQPKPNEVLLRILAGGVCHTDVGILEQLKDLGPISNTKYTLGEFIS